MTIFILLGVIAPATALLLALPILTTRISIGKKAAISVAMLTFVCAGSLGLYYLIGAPEVAEFIREWGE